MASTFEKLEPQERRSFEKKALLELRIKLEDAILGNRLLSEPPHSPVDRTRVASSYSMAAGDTAQLSLWGVPLLPSKCHEGTDAVLLKFLRARSFDPSEALEMLQKTLCWRAEFGAEGILDEDLGLPPELHGVAYIDGVDKEGHPVCYNVHGAFKDEAFCEKAFRGDDDWERFVRWRVWFMEKGIKELDFKPGGAMSMVQITDLSKSSKPCMKGLRTASKKAVSLLRDNYPEFVAKHIYVNVSFRYYFYHALFSPIIKKRRKSRSIFARPQKVTETLLKFITPERLPVQYGGLKRENDDEFTTEDVVSELVVRPGDKRTIEILILEPGLTLVWDVAVVGCEVNYKEEFIPEDEGSYRVLIQEEKKLEETVRNSFYISEPGKVVLTIENKTFKKKRALYRSKSKPTIYLYNLLNKTTDHGPVV